MNVLMPQLGETVTEGTISKWYKAVGDAVAAGEPLFDIETDKTSMEVPSIVNGVLSELRAREGETVAVGSIVAVLAEATVAETGAPAPAAAVPAAAVPAAAVPPKAAAAAPASAPAASPASAPPPARAEAMASRQSVAPSTTGPIDPFHGLRTPTQSFGRAALPGGVRSSPRARRLAAEQGVDLAMLAAQGGSRRISATDVERAADAMRTAGAVAPAAASVAAAAAGVDGAAVRAMYRQTPHEWRAIDGVRRHIARRLTESKQQVPHFYLAADLRADALLETRRQLIEASGARVSVNDLMAKAYALALRKVPAANVVWTGDGLLHFERVDLGVAVALPGGLVTPIVRGADALSVQALAAELAGLIERARSRRLLPDEYNGGTATLSNLGMYGVRSFQAIVNPPQATILAVGAIERRAVEAADGTIRGASMVTVNLSVDHRAVDGAVAAELLREFRAVVENPIRLFV